MSDEKRTVNNTLNQEPVRKLQQSLSCDRDIRNDFINSRYDSSEDSESSDSDTCQITIPKRRKRKQDSSALLLQRLTEQQQAYLKSQRKVYKLQGEVDNNEVRNNYLKLELNNAELENADLKNITNQQQMLLSRSKTENWVLRITILIYILIRIYYFF